ncbi:MAG: Rha family transcriptional regulator [Zoogloeaceae bacterium]|jgi:Rha family phage regulatory protein|nr:Rha family transcriptional regulator [Zoogloeaceae bacterium]
MNQPELFPETLLVSREGDRVFTTSRKVAEHFHKRHDHVLRDIEKLIAGDTINRPKIGEIDEHDNRLVRQFGESNFGRAVYLDGRNREQTEYHLTEEGFALLAMGFTGAKALVWKIKFLAAFRQMERDLARRTARFAAALDVVRPNLRPVTEATEAGQNRQSIAAALGKSANAITYHRRQARRFGLLEDRRAA